MGKPWPRTCGDRGASPRVTPLALGQGESGGGQRLISEGLLRGESFHLGQVQPLGLYVGYSQFASPVRQRVRRANVIWGANPRLHPHAARWPCPGVRHLCRGDRRRVGTPMPPERGRPSQLGQPVVPEKNSLG